jgi:hypothetical protein
MSCDFDSMVGMGGVVCNFWHGLVMNEHGMHWRRILGPEHAWLEATRRDMYV